MTSACGRFAALGRHERWLVIEAATLLALVWMGLRLVSFARLRYVLARYAGWRRSDLEIEADLHRVPWAVEAVSERFFRSATCLTRALVADAMLRRRRFAARLRVGVRLCGEASSRRPLEAHAWVECNNRIVIGDLDSIHEFVVPNTPHGW